MNQKIFNVFFLVIFLIGFFLFAKIFLPFLIPFILATILVTVFYPWYSRIDKYIKHPALSSIVTCIIVILIVMLPLGIFLGLLSKEAFSLFIWGRDQLNLAQVETFLTQNTLINEYRQSIEQAFHIELDPAQIQQQLSSLGKNVGLFIYSQAKNISSNIFSVAFQFILLIFILFYFFRDGKKILKRILDIIPLTETHEKHIINKFREVGSAVFWGNLVAATLQGVAGGVGLLIFGPRTSILLMSIAIAILSLVPAVGPLVVFIPASAFLMLQGNIFAGLGLLIYGILVSNILDNIIKPKMIESKIKIHPLLVFFSILGGVQVFGILGIFFGPLIVTLFLTLVDIYKMDFS